MRIAGLTGTIALTLTLGAQTCLAQSQPAGGGPAELPPAAFSARTYVDSRGCIFIRAGTPGQVRWVPRVTRRMQPVCGAVPSLAATTGAQAEVTPAVEPQADAAAPPGDRIAILPLHVMTAPGGYERAWQDGRLNPERGPRSAAGDEAMARVWTESVPMVRQGSAKAQRRASSARVQSDRDERKSKSGGGSLSGKLGISTKSSTPAAAIWVQIGAFSVPDNARRAAARITETGYEPQLVGGQSMTSVMAGPFADRDAASAALAGLRRAGFADAYLRN